MTAVIVTMVVVVTIAVLLLAYVAFPHRGERVPGASWLGDAVGRAADAVPVLRDGDLDPQAEAEEQKVPHDSGAAR